jgi:RNA polymerase sigma-70 factor (ECF subfamily)
MIEETEGGNAISEMDPVVAEAPRAETAPPESAGAAASEPSSEDASVASRLRYASPEALFRAESGALVRALTLSCGDAVLAEDAVQEAFARLCMRWKKIGSYDDPGAWVRRVALNLAHDQRRHLMRRAKLLVRVGRQSESQAVLSPGAEAASSAEAAGDPALWAAVRELPPRQRMALALYYLADLKVAEVATTMNVSEGTVKRHLDRARETLRMKLEAGHKL